MGSVVKIKARQSERLQKIASEKDGKYNRGPLKFSKS